MQIEKEVFIEYVENTVLNIKDKIEYSKEDNNEIRKTLLDLVNEIRNIKESDINYYNEILKAIPYVSFFEEEVEDLNQAKEYLSTVVNSEDNKKNQQKFAELMKSSEIYYFINKKTKKDFSEEELLALGDLGLIKDYLKAIWPSAKQEELLSILLYINSGKATKDYVEYLSKKTDENKSDYLYSKFKSALSDLYVAGEDEVILEAKSKSVISSGNRLDSGVIVDKDLKLIHMGFATSEYQTSSQEKQYFEKMTYLNNAIKDKNHELYKFKLVPVYLTNSMFNEHEIKTEQREHKKTFLNNFEQKLTYIEKNKLNCLSILSLVGNIGINDTLKFNIEDFININPYVAGADTLWIHNKFKKLSKIKNKTEKLSEFRNFLIEEAFEVLSTLDKKLNSYEIIDMDNNFTEVFKNIENMIVSTIENFNVLNIDSETLYDKETIKNISKTIGLYKKIHVEKFNSATPSKVSNLLGKNLYKLYNSEESIKLQIEDLNKDLLSASINKKQKEQDKQLKIDEIKDYSIECSEKILAHLNVDNHKEILKNKNGLKVFLSDLIENATLFPARDSKKLLSQISQQSIESRNFIQKYKSWKENEKFQNGVSLIDMLIENASNPENIIQNLISIPKKNKIK